MQFDIPNFVVGLLVLGVAAATLFYVIRQDRREKSREREADAIAREHAEWAAKCDKAATLLVQFGRPYFSNGGPLYRRLGFTAEQQARIEQYLITLNNQGLIKDARPVTTEQLELAVVRDTINVVIAAFQKFQTENPAMAKQYGIAS